MSYAHGARRRLSAAAGSLRLASFVSCFLHSLWVGDILLYRHYMQGFRFCQQIFFAGSLFLAAESPMPLDIVFQLIKRCQILLADVFLHFRRQGVKILITCHILVKELRQARKRIKQANHSFLPLGCPNTPYSMTLKYPAKPPGCLQFRKILKTPMLGISDLLLICCLCSGRNDRVHLVDMFNDKALHLRAVNIFLKVSAVGRRNINCRNARRRAFR